MGHTKKTKNIFSDYTKQFLNYKSVQLKYSCDTLDNCVATPGLKHTALDWTNCNEINTKHLSCVTLYPPPPPLWHSGLNFHPTPLSTILTRFLMHLMLKPNLTQFTLSQVYYELEQVLWLAKKNFKFLIFFVFVCIFFYSFSLCNKHLFLNKMHSYIPRL